MGPEGSPRLGNGTSRGLPPRPLPGSWPHLPDVRLTRTRGFRLALPNLEGVATALIAVSSFGKTPGFALLALAA